MSEVFWACEGCKKEFDTFDEAEKISKLLLDKKVIRDLGND